jgi:phosphoribosylformylglycinamidine cyclo-ligase
MPDLYAAGDYDLAGFCVGVVEKKNLIDGAAIVPGDIVLGIASSGFHSNGYSLIRKVVFGQKQLHVTDMIPALGRTVGDALLTPTIIYAGVIRRVLRHYKVKSVVHGIAHITGGGMLENIERIVPPGARVEIDRHAWQVPAVFPWLEQLGEIDLAEMYRVLNMGIGMVLIVSSFYADAIRRMVEDQGPACWQIGRVVAGTGDAVWAG